MNKTLIAISLSMMLAACGGGGSSKKEIDGTNSATLMPETAAEQTQPLAPEQSVNPGGEDARVSYDLYADARLQAEERQRIIDNLQQQVASYDAAINNAASENAVLLHSSEERRLEAEQRARQAEEARAEALRKLEELQRTSAAALQAQSQQTTGPAVQAGDSVVGDTVLQWDGSGTVEQYGRTMYFGWIGSQIRVMTQAYEVPMNVIEFRGRIYRPTDCQANGGIMDARMAAEVTPSQTCHFSVASN